MTIAGHHVASIACAGSSSGQPLAFDLLSWPSVEQSLSRGRRDRSVPQVVAHGLQLDAGAQCMTRVRVPHPVRRCTSQPLGSRRAGRSQYLPLEEPPHDRPQARRGQAALTAQRRNERRGWVPPRPGCRQPALGQVALQRTQGRQRHGDIAFPCCPCRSHAASRRRGRPAIARGTRKLRLDVRSCRRREVHDVEQLMR